MSDCIFCKIIAGEIPSAEVYRDEWIRVFKDVNPVAPVHVLIVPVKHIKSMEAFAEADPSGELAAHIFKLIPKLAAQLGLSERGYRLINNCGEEGGQTVPHFHIHLIGGEALGDKLR